ncbi:DUF2231 domain-containing protein [Micromonospora viridifaciens]|uniref:DUF2231 domain-containing protein n=1 Tax=Micromonospora viridifaciens TaxID=1881 RepID=UPI0018D5770E|nr:DUF2231 domain-containing protein [Micromonospora viridifaciens]
MTVLAGRYGHPVHPALVAVPIGAWVASFVFDVASHLVHDGGFLAQGSRWLIAVGVLGAVAAAMAGFLDLVAIPTGTRVFRIGLAHMSINLVVTAAYVVGYVIRGGAGTGPVRWGPLALSAAALAGLAVSGYLGGELAYRYGVRVADEATQARGYEDRTVREERG